MILELIAQCISFFSAAIPAENESLLDLKSDIFLDSMFTEDLKLEISKFYVENSSNYNLYSNSCDAKLSKEDNKCHHISAFMSYLVSKYDGLIENCEGRVFKYLFTEVTHKNSQAVFSLLYGRIREDVFHLDSRFPLPPGVILSSLDAALANFSRADGAACMTTYSMLKYCMELFIINFLDVSPNLIQNIYVILQSYIQVKDDKAKFLKLQLINNIMLLTNLLEVLVILIEADNLSVVNPMNHSNLESIKLKLKIELGETSERLLFHLTGFGDRFYSHFKHYFNKDARILFKNLENSNIHKLPDYFHHFDASISKTFDFTVINSQNRNSCSKSRKIARSSKKYHGLIEKIEVLADNYEIYKADEDSFLSAARKDEISKKILRRSLKNKDNFMIKNPTIEFGKEFIANKDDKTLESQKQCIFPEFNDYNLMMIPKKISGNMAKREIIGQASLNEAQGIQNNPNIDQNSYAISKDATKSQNHDSNYSFLNPKEYDTRKDLDNLHGIDFVPFHNGSSLLSSTNCSHKHDMNNSTNSSHLFENLFSPVQQNNYCDSKLSSNMLTNVLNNNRMLPQPTTLLNPANAPDQPKNFTLPIPEKLFSNPIYFNPINNIPHIKYPSSLSASNFHQPTDTVGLNQEYENTISALVFFNNSSFANSQSNNLLGHPNQNGELITENQSCLNNSLSSHHKSRKRRFILSKSFQNVESDDRKRARKH